MSHAVDPITVSVVQHRLRAIVEEMGEAMLRTSYSQILNSSRDFSTALCDPDGRLIAQAEHVPIHVGALPFAARSVHEFFKGADTPRRRLPAQRSLSRRQPPARPDRVRARVRRRPPGVLVHQPLASERHRRRHPRRLQRQRDRDLPGRHPHPAADALRAGQAARGRLRDDRAQRAPSPRLPRRPRRHDRLGARSASAGWGSCSPSSAPQRPMPPSTPCSMAPSGRCAPSSPAGRMGSTRARRSSTTTATAPATSISAPASPSAAAISTSI